MNGQSQRDDPFRRLGLDRRGDLADDEVRSAWHRVAASTHPDRIDGGDPAAFAAASAAYALLRTPAGRGEALADLLATPADGRPRSLCARSWRHPSLLVPAAALLAIRLRRGRPVLLSLRVLTAVAVSVIVVVAAGWQPASLAVIVGTLTWLVLTARSDMASSPW
jgi:hypothetical protein